MAYTTPPLLDSLCIEMGSGVIVAGVSLTGVGKVTGTMFIQHNY